MRSIATTTGRYIATDYCPSGNGIHRMPGGSKPPPYAINKQLDKLKFIFRVDRNRLPMAAGLDLIHFQYLCRAFQQKLLDDSLLAGYGQL